MAEQQDEPLQHRHLDQHEAGAKRAEVHQPRQPPARARVLPVGKRQRADHEEHDEDRRDPEQCHQRAQAVAEQHRLSERDVELVLQLRRVEEKRSIVGRRSDVGAVARVELRAIGRANQPRVVGGCGAVDEEVRRGLRKKWLDSLFRRLRRCHARRVEDVKAKTIRDRAQRRDFLRSIRRLLQHEGRHAALADDRKTIGGGPAAMRTGRLRQRHEAQAVGDPARDRQHAVRVQMIEVVVERLDCVQRVLGERVRARRRRGPRVDERRLDHIVPIRRPAHEAPAVVDCDADARICVDASREIAEPIAHHVVGDDRVDLDAVDARRAEDERRREIAAAARADDERSETGIRDRGLGIRRD